MGDGYGGREGLHSTYCLDVSLLSSEVSGGLAPSPPARAGTPRVHGGTAATTPPPPRCRGRFSRTAMAWQSLRWGVGRQKQTAVQVAILRDCHPPMPAERRSGGATVCQDCHVSACSESDRLWPARQRLPARDHHQVGLEGLQSRTEGTARPGTLPVTFFFSPGFLFRRQFVHASPTIGLEPRQSLPERRSLTLGLTHPRTLRPFPGCRLSLTVVPYCIASRPRRAAVPGARHLTARNVSFSPWGIQLRGQHACPGASDANSRARADKAETNTPVPWTGPPPPILFLLVVTVMAVVACALCVVFLSLALPLAVLVFCFSLAAKRGKEGAICRRLLAAHDKKPRLSSGLI